MWPGTHEVAVSMHQKLYENGWKGRHSAVLYYEITYENECQPDIGASTAAFDAYIAEGIFDFTVQ